MKLILESCRHLTGPSLYSHMPGTVLDASISGITVDEVVECWQEEVQMLREAVGWKQTPLLVRSTQPHGASLAFNSSIDAVLSATELNKAAWNKTVARLTGDANEDFDEIVVQLKDRIQKESDPALLKLHAAAKVHGLQLLADDEAVTLGLGTGSKSWPAGKLPAPYGIDWNAIHNVPVALITGTNGKSTTGRLLASIVTADGKVSGQTSTDWIQVGEEILGEGDYSGPGGARAILRDKRVEFGVLESARGGMLRRGLGVTEAQAGIITNVAEEHLGQYGVHCLADLIDVKFTILRPLEATKGTLVLNADDAGLVEYAKKINHTFCWFSMDAESAVLSEHRNQGGEVCYHDQGKIYYAKGESTKYLLNVKEIPITLNGAARYNIANCLGVIALAKNLGFNDEVILKALREFQGDMKDNPGRGNYLTFPLPKANCSNDSQKDQTFQVLIDFAHNAHGLNAVCETVNTLKAKRRLVVAGHVGSHSDEEIREMTRAVTKIKPVYFVSPQMNEFLRGRKAGEIPILVHDELRLQGFEEEEIASADTSLEGVKKAVKHVQAGDLLMLVGLDQRDEIITFLNEL
ncbi:MAG: Cyanophycin synthetase [Deltaproteobacteria bacterium]|nr:Cyanophycin synthetase [Deltaproteobacteria bacterium]